MNFLPDPSLRFSHPANRGVVAFLRCQAERAPGADTRAPVDCDGFVLHTGTDLCGRLAGAASALPEPCDAFLFGCAVLAVRGIVFVLAYGELEAVPRHPLDGTADGRLAVRLAHLDAVAAYRTGAQPEPALGDDWLCVHPWQPNGPQAGLAYWCRRAYRNALALPERPFG